MDQARFEEVFERQVELCRAILIKKAAEYADDKDRLRNFEQAAALQCAPRIQALGGMMVKHTVSIYDMIFSDGDFSQDVWTEKITDHINYLILLQAILVEEQTIKPDQMQLPFDILTTTVRETNHA